MFMKWKNVIDCIDDWLIDEWMDYEWNQMNNQEKYGVDDKNTNHDSKKKEGTSRIGFAIL